MSGKIKWGPVVKGKVKLSITDTYGHFFETVEELEKRAEEGDIEDEIKAQIELAFKYGLAVSHIDNHMGSLYGFYGRTFLPLVFKYCKKYNLPFRLPRYLKDNFPDFLSL